MLPTIVDPSVRVPVVKVERGEITVWAERTYSSPIGSAWRFDMMRLLHTGPWGLVVTSQVLDRLGVDRVRAATKRAIRARRRAARASVRQLRRSQS